MTLQMKQITILWKIGPHTFKYVDLVCFTFHVIMHLYDFLALSGYCTPYLKLACFVYYLKIINTFQKNNPCIFSQIV